MILSKGNLQAVEIVRGEKGTPILNNVKIEQDGSTACVTANMVLVVSGVLPEMKKQLPLEEEEVGEGIGSAGILLHSSSALEIIKVMSKDTLFEGRLEHCNIDKEGNVVIHDGKGQRKMKATLTKFKEFAKYKEVIGRVMQEKDTFRIVAPVGRLHLMLKAIEKICGADGGIAYLEFTKKGEIIIRAENNKNGQRVLGVVWAYKGFEDKWLKNNYFEEGFIKNLSMEKRVERIIKLKKK